MSWDWNNFSKKEIACRGTTCGCNNELWNVDKYTEVEPEYFTKSMNALQALRDEFGKPIIINSAHRCAKHNEAVGGAVKSKHLDIAFDCKIKKEDRVEFVKIAKKHGFNGIGYYSNFIHIDIRQYLTEWRGNY